MEEANSTINKNLVTKEKAKLKKEIETLKSLHLKIKKEIEVYQTSSNKSSSVNDEEEIQDWKSELCKLSGLFCSKFNPGIECQFEFYNFNSRKEPYFIQILHGEEEIKLGVWNMPVFLDMEEILSKCPLEDSSQVKNFILLCKHYLHCQENRRSQFRDLKDYLDNLSKCSVQANLEIYTCIELQIHYLREIENNKIYNIVLYIIYELNECRPCNLIIDSVFGEPLTKPVIQKLRKLFRNFKYTKLRPTFEKIHEEKDIFQWNFSYLENNQEIADLDSSESRDNLQEEDQSSVEENPKKSDEQNVKNTKKRSSNKKKKKENTAKNGTNKLLQIKNSTIEEGTSKGNDEKRKINPESRLKAKNKVTQKNKSRQVGKKLKKAEKQTTLDFLQKSASERIQDLDLQSKELKMREKHSEKQITVNFSRDGPERPENLNSQLAELEEQSTNEKTRIDDKRSQMNTTNTTSIKNNRKVKKSRSKQKTKVKKVKNTDENLKASKSKGTFNLANFILKRKPKNMLTNELASSDNLLKPIPKITKSSTPIPGRRKLDIEVDTEISNITVLNKPVKKSVKKRIIMSDSSDSEFNEVVEEPNESLINELEGINENFITDRSKNRKNLTKARKKMKKR